MLSQRASLLCKTARLTTDLHLYFRSFNPISSLSLISSSVADLLKSPFPPWAHPQWIIKALLQKFSFPSTHSIITDSNNNRRPLRTQLLGKPGRRLQRSRLIPSIWRTFWGDLCSLSVLIQGHKIRRSWLNIALIPLLNPSTFLDYSQP